MEMTVDTEFVERVKALREATILSLEGVALLFEKRGSGVVARVMRDRMAVMERDNQLDESLLLMAWSGCAG